MVVEGRSKGGGGGGKNVSEKNIMSSGLYFLGKRVLPYMAFIIQLY